MVDHTSLEYFNFSKILRSSAMTFLCRTREERKMLLGSSHDNDIRTVAALIYVRRVYPLSNITLLWVGEWRNALVILYESLDTGQVFAPVWK